ncbi:MAG: hypothetical protein AUG75_08290 [Cyanobacteria bacterium 13_1_20CM_4_61_6]|nr:MAG: hypothetical protein AUG75_08290 [Cyanobacteria bacterium 13_1_20CM_4_61_6]
MRLVFPASAATGAHCEQMSLDADWRSAKWGRKVGLHAQVHDSSETLVLSDYTRKAIAAFKAK